MQILPKKIKKIAILVPKGPIWARGPCIRAGPYLAHCPTKNVKNTLKYHKKAKKPSFSPIKMV